MDSDSSDEIVLLAASGIVARRNRTSTRLYMHTAHEVNASTRYGLWKYFIFRPNFHDKNFDQNVLQISNPSWISESQWLGLEWLLPPIRNRIWRATRSTRKQVEPSAHSSPSSFGKKPVADFPSVEKVFIQWQNENFKSCRKRSLVLDAKGRVQHWKIDRKDGHRRSRWCRDLR